MSMLQSYTARPYSYVDDMALSPLDIDFITPSNLDFIVSDGGEMDFIAPDGAGAEMDFIPPSSIGADMDFIPPESSDGNQPVGDINISPDINLSIGGKVPKIGGKKKGEWYEKEPGQTDRSVLPDGVQYDSATGMYRWIHYTNDGKAIERMAAKPPTAKDIKKNRKNFNVQETPARKVLGITQTGTGVKSNKPLDVRSREATHYIGKTRVGDYFGKNMRRSRAYRPVNQPLLPGNNDTNEGDNSQKRQPPPAPQNTSKQPSLTPTPNTVQTAPPRQEPAEESTHGLIQRTIKATMAEGVTRVPVSLAREAINAWLSGNATREETLAKVQGLLRDRALSSTERQKIEEMQSTIEQNQRKPTVTSQATLGEDFATNENLSMPMGTGEGETSKLADPSQLQARSERRRLEGLGQTAFPPVDIGHRGSRTTAQGTTNPDKTYEFNWRVADVDSIVPSHHYATMQPNPQYPADLQPRGRDRMASEQQVKTIARQLNPDMLLNDTHMLDFGAPIIGPDGMVESGSGRAMAIQRAKAMHPDRYRAYVDKLRDPETLGRIGFKPENIEGVENPILVRERVGDLPTPERIAFAREANAPRAMTSSVTEGAMQHADAFDANQLSRIEIPDTATTEGVLLHSANRDIADRFLRSYSPNEIAQLSDTKGNLSKSGLDALRDGLFANVYGRSDAGKNLNRELQENIDEDIVRVGNALKASLPRIARAEALVRSGKCDRDDSIAEDIAVAVQTMRRLKRQGMPVENYLRSYNAMDDNMTPDRKRLLVFLDANRNSARKMTDLLNEYADMIYRKPHVRQSGLMAGMIPSQTKSEFLEERIPMPSGSPPLSQDMSFKPPDMGKRRRQGLA